MYQVIAPTLFNNKICKLPGIGTLLMVQKAAETDFVNSLVTSPTEFIDFLPANEHEKIFNEFSAISELLLQHLEEEGTVSLKGIGSFIKKEDGNLQFSAVPLQVAFTQPVQFERVIRENVAHSIMVGDRERTNVQMAEYLTEKPVVKQRWRLIALILGIVGLGLLIFYLARYGFNGLGNIRSI